MDNFENFWAPFDDDLINRDESPQIINVWFKRSLILTSLGMSEVDSVWAWSGQTSTPPISKYFNKKGVPSGIRTLDLPHNGQRRYPLHHKNSDEATRNISNFIIKNLIFCTKNQKKLAILKKNQYLKYGKNSLNTLAPRILSP